MPTPKRAAPTDRPVLVWFRDDLRLADNRALVAAATGQPVLAVYVFDEHSPGIRPLGGALRWWLHHSLAALAADLAKLGTALHVYRGAAGARLPKIARAVNATAVFWSRRYGAAERAVDTAVKSLLRDAGIKAESFNDHLLVEPWDIKTKAGEPFKVFTPFWQTARRASNPPPVGQPKRLRSVEPPASPKPITLDALALLPTKPDCAGGLRPTWTPGETGVRKQLSQFIARRLPGYAASRDRPDLALTSRLSPHLRFGEISPRQVWPATARAAEGGTAPHADVETYVRRWVPELAKLPAKHIHQPWDAPPAVLDAASIKLGRDYPHPSIALDEGRAPTLTAFDKIKR